MLFSIFIAWTKWFVLKLSNWWACNFHAVVSIHSAGLCAFPFVSSLAPSRTTTARGLEQPELLTGLGDLCSSVAGGKVWGGSPLRGASAVFLAQAAFRQTIGRCVGILNCLTSPRVFCAWCVWAAVGLPFGVVSHGLPWSVQCPLFPRSAHPFFLYWTSISLDFLCHRKPCTRVGWYLVAPV